MTQKIDPLNEPVSHLPQLEFIRVREDTTFGKALGLMRKSRAGSVLVCRSGRLIGWLNQRRILEKFAVEKVPAKTPLRELMARDPITVTPRATVAEAIALMRRENLRGLPMVDDKGRVLGLVTVTQIVRYVAAHFPAEVMNLPPELDRHAEQAEGA